MIQGTLKAKTVENLEKYVVKDVSISPGRVLCDEWVKVGFLFQGSFTPGCDQGTLLQAVTRGHYSRL